MKNTSGLGIGWDMTCINCGTQFRSFSHKTTTCSTDCRFSIYQNRGSEKKCWEWVGPINNEGYGVLFLNMNKNNGRRMMTTAHRYSYSTAFGEIPTEKPCVMHTCDNRKCTNPKHLITGTWYDNNHDRSIKGRSGSKNYSKEERARYSKMLQGSGNPCAKLNEDIAKEIKYSKGKISNKKTAKIYNISVSVVCHIRTNRAWKHI